MNLDDPIDRARHAQMLKDVFTVHQNFGGVFDDHPPLYGVFETDQERQAREGRRLDHQEALERQERGYPRSDYEGSKPRAEEPRGWFHAFWNELFDARPHTP